MSYLLQEDGISKIILEDGSGFLLLDEGPGPITTIYQLMGQACL